MEAEERIARAARRVVEARLSRRPLPRLSELADIEEGYRAQELANAELAQVLGPVRALKIGGTQEAMRAYIGSDEPVFGAVFASTLFGSGVRLPFSAFVRLGIETEIAVVLAQDVAPRPRPWTPGEAAEVVGEMCAAIEIVDDRYEDWRSAGAPTVVADNAFNAALVLGPCTAPPPFGELPALRARLFVDGVPQGEATADALMGHPFAALAWLLGRCGRLGRHIPAGTVVSLGTIPPVYWPQGPVSVRIEVERLGEAELVLA